MVEPVFVCFPWWMVCCQPGASGYLAPGGGCEVLFSHCLSVYLSVCVCPANILVFYQGHRDGTLLFEGIVISQKLSHRQFFFFS